ncbi:MAG: Gfo/Idh/MocA family oxidoreductase [Planctomycetaceae bacterium]|nr:Gfo/Idh/MocA family oxidoreductase [Planctomycetaceae bacterium]
MQLTPEQRAIGKENFHNAIGVTRREFLGKSLAAGVVSGAGLGGFYYGYEKIKDPVRVAVIGTGDEGNVLIGAHTPEYVDIVAIADIRPYNVWRAFNGDWSSPNARAARPGLNKKIGADAAKKIKIYGEKEGSYTGLFADKEKLGLEGVIIALPLHLHDVVAIEAMRAGLHVLTEKLMAHSIGQCKDMGRVSAKTKKLCATGHQRHYSILYDNAVDTIKRGLIGDVHHIRAQWHRGNLPGKDSWQPPLPGDDKLAKDLAKLEKDMASYSVKPDDIVKRMEQLAEQIKDKDVDASKHGYQEYKLPDSTVSPLEELIRWRLFNRTGGGLMAELGSHQLDASGIFVSAQRSEKARPLSVTAVGVRSLFPHDRDVDDHVHCIYEYPGKDYDPKDEAKKQKKVVVSYSSINGNGFGDYGEVVMGTKGTLILEREQEVMLYKDASTTTKVSVAKGKDGAPVLDTTASGGAAAAVAKAAIEAGPISRGYTEEIEHWAWCIRNPDPKNQPKCHPEVAMADAIIALTTNLAMRKGERIDFKPEWFDINSDETPEGKPPKEKVS